ncbi:MAG: M3 family oligoendopeptidase [Treponemataceae bacterium]|nr:M3 family oligoendopeptidase [Treponemataceae bacterium]
MPDGSKPLPRWDLSPIYDNFDSPQYQKDKTTLKVETEKLLLLLSTPLPDIGEPSSRNALVQAIVALLHAYERCGDLAENLEAYASAIYTADTKNVRALKEINEIEALSLPLGKAAVLLRSRLAEKEAFLGPLLEHPELSPYRFFIEESLLKARHQMSVDLEDLANDLCRSGADAWSRLQEAISSNLSVLWDTTTGEKKTVVALRNLAFHPDRSVRKRAYQAELEAWKSMEIPLAASLNGVKGFAISVDSRRGWKSPIEKAAFQARISMKTLDALISTIEKSLPLFRRYLILKARVLGIARCAFFDLFAPVGKNHKRWSWEETKEFVSHSFDTFDPGMGDFARHAFAHHWIDAEVREGKIGGAYCTDFPLQGESRVLCNFEGSFDSVSTVAHELGHAWHHEVIKDLPRTLTAYPMTLAETASTFAETLILEKALERASTEEQLFLIENSLKDACQVLVDILSRFYFERSLFEKRATAELSPEELCSLMVEAQKATYGEGLDPEFLHPYMWAVKSHYYNQALGFYNFPYAFGQLFAYGLYRRFQKEGRSFAETYRKLLRLTGQAPAEAVGKAAGFTIEDPSFWESGISLIQERVDLFEHLIEETL